MSWKVTIEAQDEFDADCIKERAVSFFRTLEGGDWSGRVIEIEHITYDGLEESK